MAERDNPDFSRARVYDDVAETYERVNVPHMFAEPARALVADVAPPSAARILDVGSGTGAVARAARAAAGPDAFVVLVDASASMLLAARNAGLNDAVVAMLPALPFPDAVFDVVTSAFVMTHLDDPDAAAREMARVLGAGGRIGLSGWCPGDDAVLRAWSRVVNTFVPAERLEAAARATLPADERFARPGSLAELLQGAGFRDVATREHRVECAMTVDEYIEGREVCATGRALRLLLADAEAIRLRHDLRASLRRQFSDGVRFDRAFHTATGIRV